MAFTPDQIKQINELIDSKMQKNYFAGSPDTAPHEHNGTDNLNINPVNLVGFTPLPTSDLLYLNQVQNEDGTITNPGVQEYGFASKITLQGGDSSTPSQFLTDTTISQYPIPIVNGFGVGVQGAFNGGYAPEGTLVYFNNATLGGLYIRVDGAWRGVNFNLTA